MAVATAPPSPTQQAPGETPVHRVGEKIFEIVADVGDVAIFSFLTFSWMFRRRTRWSVLVPNFYAIGVSSVPVVAITGTFIGMVLAVQAHSQFAMMGLATRLGSVINISLVKELGPVLAATMLAGRVGSSMSAELGTMRVTEQIDALTALGTNPIHYLVVPRFLACFLLIPLLTLMADFMGVIGGAVVSTQLLMVDSFAYWQHSREYVGGLDLLAGVFKSFFFGAAIALISCHRGFHSRRGRGCGPRGDRGVRLLVHRHPVPRLHHRDRLERRLQGHLAPVGEPAMSTSVAANAASAQANRAPIIELAGVTMRFRQQAVLRDLSLRIERGQTACIIGESGCGKTVLLKLMIALLRPSRGTVKFDGRDLATLDEHELTRTRLRFGFLFQMAALFDSLTIYDNVAFGPREHNLFDEETLRRVVAERLQEVGLPPGLEQKKPAELSGGQRKRVGLARALALNPEVMLYDEPTTGLDPIMSDVINELILQTQHTKKTTGVVVTHDMKTVTKVADRVVMLYPLARLSADESQVLYDGPPDGLEDDPDPRVRQFVRGEAGERLRELAQGREK